MSYALALLAGYLIGSIPFGLVLTRIAGYGDIRQIGSGNIGATNVLRTGNKPLALATLLLDGGKGAVAVVIFSFIFGVPGMIVGLGAILGHCFPVWLNFKGGKGVATTLGTLLVAAPLTGLSAIAVWLGMAFLFRISSLAALTAMSIAPIVTLLAYGPFAAVLNALISALVFYRHRENIVRLRAGEEPRIGRKKAPATETDENGAP